MDDNKHSLSKRISLLKYSFLFSLTLYYFFSIGSFAATPLEKKEVRYTKALIQFNSRNFPMVVKLLLKNIKSEPFHEDSFALLGTIHEERKKFLKANRIYRYILKKRNKEEYAKIRSTNELKKFLENTSKPNDQVLQYMYKLGTNFLFHYQNTDFDHQAQKKWTYKKASHFFNILLHYDYQTVKILYFQGVLNKLHGKIRTSLTYLEEAKEKITNGSPDKKDKTLLQSIHFYIGENLLHEGHTNLSMRYFKKVFSTTESSSLKNYSSLYLNSLISSQFSLGASLHIGYDTNANQLDKSQLNNFTANKAEFGKKAGKFHEKNVSLFYNTGQSQKTSFLFNIDYQDKIYTSKNLEQNDTRTMSLVLEYQRERKNENYFKLNYNYFLNMAKNIGDERNFKSSQAGHSITPILELSYEKSHGVLSLPLAYNLTQSTGEKSYDLSLSYSHTPWGINKLLSPTFFIQVSQIFEDKITEENESYQQVTFSLNNHMNFSHTISSFAGINYQKDLNNNSENKTSQWTGSVLTLFDLSKHLLGLYLETSYEYSLTMIGNLGSQDIENHAFKVGLSFSI